MTYTPPKKILIIDDEPDLCLLLKNYFRRKEYEVVTANTLREGEVLIHSMQPDVVFLDNNLPDGAGWNMAADIAQKFPSIFLVMISAFNRTPPPMPDGANYHTIEKPISIAELERKFSGL